MMYPYASQRSLRVRVVSPTKRDLNANAHCVCMRPPPVWAGSQKHDVSKNRLGEAQVPALEPLLWKRFSGQLVTLISESPNAVWFSAGRDRVFIFVWLQKCLLM